MRQLRGDPGRMRLHAAAPAAVSLQGLRGALRRPYRHGAGQAPHQPLRVWVLCHYFIGLNLSDRQIAGELGLCVPDVQVVMEQLRHGLIANTPAVELSGEVEVDEVHVLGCNKGQPAAVARRGHSDGVRRPARVNQT